MKQQVFVLNPFGQIILTYSLLISITRGEQQREAYAQQWLNQAVDDDDDDLSLFCSH